MNKRGVSVLIGYVLLVVFVVIMAAIVFNWLRTYVPAESLNCPDSVSLFIKEYTLDCDANTLNLTMKNNGRFSYAGFFIHASNESGQEVATIDFSQYLKEKIGEIIKLGNSVIYIGDGDNIIKPGNESGAVFNFSSTLGNISSVTLVPTRFQVEKGRNRLVSCNTGKLTQEIQCGTESVSPPTCIPAADPTYEALCSGRVCGSVTNGSCGLVTCLPDNCGTGFFCDAAGQCISSSCTPAADPTLSGICGSQRCGTAQNGTCGAVTCGVCGGGFECDVTTNQCVSTIGNGRCDAGEDCSEPACVGLQASCPANQICSSGGSCITIGNGLCDSGETCSQEPVACEGQQAQCQVGETCVSGSCTFNAQGSFNSCADYCDLFSGYNTGGCVQNPQQCGGLIPPGTYIGIVPGANETRGNSYCTTGNADTCCCQP